MVETETQIQKKARESQCPVCKSKSLRPEQKEGVMTGKLLCLNCRKVF